METNLWDFMPFVIVFIFEVVAVIYLFFSLNKTSKKEK